MPRGQPDYIRPEYEISQVSFDPSLFLTALKGVNSVDGKGRVWKIDNFGDGPGAWTTDAAGNGNLPILSSANPEIGSTSVLMDAGTLAGGGESIFVQTNIVNRPVIMGFEAGFYVDDFSPDYDITIDYRITGGSLLGGLKFSINDRKLYIRTSTGYIAIASLNINPTSPGWLPIKVVIDFTNRKYIRAVYGGVSLDVSSYSPYSVVADGIGALRISIHATAVNNTGFDGYLGHTIITLDEP